MKTGVTILIALTIFLLLLDTCSTPKQVEVVTLVDTLWLEQDTVVHTRWITTPGVKDTIRDTIPGDTIHGDTIILTEVNRYEEEWVDTNGTFKVTSWVEGVLHKQQLTYQLLPLPVVTTTIKETVTSSPKSSLYIGGIINTNGAAHIKADLLVNRYLLTAGYGKQDGENSFLVGFSFRLFKK